MILAFSNIDLLVRTRDGRHCILQEPFTVTDQETGESWTVDIGASSDGASSPPISWNTLPPFGTYWPAAFLHDDLYRRSKWAKEKCDVWFLAAMEALQVKECEKRVLYEGVHLFGGPSFKEDRQ